ncbi:methyl-accepting chemotaxis protein [Burkholderia gladioli pv. gladioli]|uniref:Methyl-accepting chemotaxis (MCP) signaling domain protein n=1 Tax=Burkholderia gladioli TaxID=28095 RepID=A0AAW3ESQ9_BURGA|nr:methyl-accepting chemotaxis protein [Burkholderia gladioli]AJW98340.1 methyl-accepting chemotaxis (MCP) signaling domain protein [Burkholderia gladioli]ASD81400.1 chemotaxis protein [Burkholderia gladioli pv. gladioli]AWY56913.1 chemotaxis protein [Burkholderia gladioli pv. gladioli]KGC11040.1 methyl-accepting chemotaxis (MCP) signaling domain protein [Burkholderia gladioli]MDJ1164045.1 methyl-accepting chemotaxis protein [Burkholderia gladioli pv. gladioli]
MSSLRSRILIISSATVIGALALSGAAAYFTVRANTMETIAQNLDAIAGANTLAIDKWVEAKAQAVKASAEDVEHGDPQGFVKHMGRASGFPITTVGWSDKSFFSTTSTAPGYDPTARPWYKAALAAGTLVVTKPYGDSSTGAPYVSFSAPMMRNGAADGVVSGAVPLEGVREVVSTVHPTPASLAFVVTRDGQVIAHPDAKLALKPATDIAEALTPAALASLAQAGAPMEIALGGVVKLLKAQPVAGTDWYLVIALDKAEATAGLSRVLRTLGVAMLLLTLAAVGLAAFFTSNSFRSLSRVRDAMDTIGSGGGDLTHRLPVAGRDEVAQISASFNAFVDKISAVLHDVKSGVDSMKLATDEIEMGNRDLSQRTETSASNLQHTSAALTELTASVKQSAESAMEASRLATSASEAAARGGAVVTSAVSTMDEIARASARITEIIGVIDGIAFQTNILALNAAVEAARAGEHGRGFAVVAGEVRTLAQRCATAAREIKDLIQSSEASVDTGAQRVQAAGAAMREIVEGIERVNRVIGEIDGAMNEQSTGISQIDRSVAEMDQATQQNAALVEQSTAASATLNEQAHGLSGIVGLFRLRQAAAA